ncbi:MAG: RDD family protein [Thermoplasmata archaeon]|nr:RDD family protein [Thermoplasmata archaeon]
MGQGNYQQPPPQQQQAPPPQYQQPPPQGYYPPQHIGHRMEHADIVQRFIAILIDAIIIVIPVAIIIFIALIGTDFTDPDSMGMFSGSYLLMSVLPVLLMLMYFVVMEGSSSGATIGKKVMKLKVVDEQYRPIDMSKAFVRNILRWIPYIGTIVFIIDVILIITRDDKQSFRDTLAHTYVVRVNPQYAGQMSQPPQQYQQQQYQQPYQQAPPPQYPQAPPPQQPPQGQQPPQY